jgi:hypothetical protein
MADSDTISTIKTQALANISTITASPKPTYTIDGQTVSWNDYLKLLQQTVEWCNKQLAAETPFEHRSQGYT